MEEADLSRPAATRGARSRRRARGGAARCSTPSTRCSTRLEAERRAGASAALEAQERERARIALDLHDEVNQSLTGLLLRIEALRRKAPEELAEELAETSAVAAQAMEELLTLARRLRPTTLDDLGLDAALASWSRRSARAAGDRAPLRVRGRLRQPLPDVQLVAYRIAQEALSNAVQHARAEHVRVRLHRDRRAASSCGSPTTARASTPSRTDAASGSPGCASARCWSTARSRSNPTQSQGTRVRLRA